MRFQTRDPRAWRRVFAWLPVPLCDERHHGRRAWLQTVERKHPNWITTNGPIPVYRPIGSDWEPEE